MIILIAAVLGLVLGALAGGRPGRLARLRLRGVPLLVLAFAVQFTVITLVPTGPPALLEALHVLSYVGAGAVVWLNRAVPGLLVAGLGGTLNGAVIALNGGTLPASETALRGAGLDTHPGEFVNSGVLPDPVLPWLGDVFWVPAAVPLANVFSVGDVLLVGAVTWGAYRTCRRATPTAPGATGAVRPTPVPAG